MEVVTYEVKDQHIAVVKANDVVLRIGGAAYPEARIWVVSTDMLRVLQNENPTVEFRQVQG